MPIGDDDYHEIVEDYEGGRHPKAKRCPEHHLLVEHARAWLLRAVWDKDGAKCPTCYVMSKVYPRPITKNGVKDLTYLYGYWKKFGHKFHHYNDFLSYYTRSTSHGDFAKFKYFDVVEHGDNDDSKKNASGMYRITEKGMMFVEGKIAIQEIAVTYHDVLLYYKGDRKTIDDFWPDFDFQDLMQSPDDV